MANVVCDLVKASIETGSVQLRENLYVVRHLL